MHSRWLRRVLLAVRNYVTCQCYYISLGATTHFLVNCASLDIKLCSSSLYRYIACGWAVDSIKIMKHLRHLCIYNNTARVKHYIVVCKLRVCSMLILIKDKVYIYLDEICIVAAYNLHLRNKYFWKITLKYKAGLHSRDIYLYWV